MPKAGRVEPLHPDMPPLPSEHDKASKDAQLIDFKKAQRERALKEREAELEGEFEEAFQKGLKKERDFSRQDTLRKVKKGEAGLLAGKTEDELKQLGKKLRKEVASE